MVSTLINLAHRPWPLPERKWTLSMRWEDLLFMHWPVDAAALRRKIPAGLELDLFAGQAWLGVVPFRMVDTRFRALPPMPFASSFPELNVRTYVRCNGKPGVWFFSLDAASWLAVETARRFFHLPYEHAQMAVETVAGSTRYQSVRRDGMAKFEGSYRAVGPVTLAKPGTLEHWLTERYCLYSADSKGDLWRGEIHHSPWPLQSAEVEVRQNTMTAPLGISLPDTQPVVHFAKALEVVAWSINRV